MYVSKFCNDCIFSVQDLGFCYISQKTSLAIDCRLYFQSTSAYTMYYIMVMYKHIEVRPGVRKAGHDQYMWVSLIGSIKQQSYFGYIPLYRLVLDVGFSFSSAFFSWSFFILFVTFHWITFGYGFNSGFGLLFQYFNGRSRACHCHDLFTCSNDAGVSKSYGGTFMEFRL